MQEVYLIFKIVALLGAGAALDRAWLASKKMWENRIGRDVNDTDTTRFETSPQAATLVSTGEDVIALPLLSDSNISDTDNDGQVYKTDLSFQKNQ